MSGLHDAALEQFEQALSDALNAHYRFTLFVSGASELSARAVASFRAFCDRELPGRYTLDVVDVHQHPDRVRSARVLAVPTLLLEEPPPCRMVVGDLSDAARLRRLLDLLDVSDSSRNGG